MSVEHKDALRHVLDVIFGTEAPWTIVWNDASVARVKSVVTVPDVNEPLIQEAISLLRNLVDPDAGCWSRQTEGHAVDILGRDPESGVYILLMISRFYPVGTMCACWQSPNEGWPDQWNRCMVKMPRVKDDTAPERGSAARLWRGFTSLFDRSKPAPSSVLELLEVLKEFWSDILRAHGYAYLDPDSPSFQQRVAGRLRAWDYLFYLGFPD